MSHDHLFASARADPEPDPPGALEYPVPSKGHIMNQGKDKIRVGVVGVGSIGRNHARVYSEIQNASLAAVWDTNPAAAREAAARHKCRAVESLDEFVKLVDAASVATPTPTHHDIGMRLMEAGVDVLIEKPITESAEDAHRLVEGSIRLGRILQVGHIERFNPVLHVLEERIGTPRFIESHRLSPYPNRSVEIGVVLDLMIHDIEIILHLVKSPIASIDAVGVAVLSAGEDIANARLRFENGCVANVTASRISPEKLRKLRLFSGDAYLSLDYQNQSGEIYRKSEGQITREKVRVDKGEPLFLELQAFVNCCREGASPKVGGREAAAALEVASRITKLIEEAPDFRPAL